MLPSGAWRWRDAGDLPERMPAKVRGFRETIIGMAVAPGLVTMLHGQENRGGRVFVLALRTSGRGRELTAWRCRNQGEAARLATELVAEWVRAGWGVTVTLAGATRAGAAEALPIGMDQAA